MTLIKQTKSNGLLLALEGGDGAGKSTQVQHLEVALKRMGFPTLVVRSPGVTHFGHLIHSWLRDPERSEDLTGRDELMLMLSDRMLVLQEVVRPALNSGFIVILDQYIPSTYLRQGILKGVPFETINRFHQYLDIEQPRCYVHLDIADEQCPALVERLAARANHEVPTRHDEATAKLTLELTRAYRRIMADPVCVGNARVETVNAMQSEYDVHCDIVRALKLAVDGVLYQPDSDFFKVE